MSQQLPTTESGRGLDAGRLLDPVRRHPLAALGWALVAVGLVLGLVEGWREIAQATINGVVAGNYFALGAVGLTLIFGVLRLVNFAHGEFLTFGAYMLIVGNALDLPLALSVVFGVVATAALGLLLELGLWRPVRRKRVGELQLLLWRWASPSSCGTRSRSSPAPRTARAARTSPQASASASCG